MITVDLLMATKPCPDWPRERVEALLARPEIDRSSWTAFAASCLAADAVSLADLRLTAYRAATPTQRLLGVRRSTRVNVEAQVARWPVVSAEVAAVRADLLRWAAGESLDIEDVRRRSRAAAYAAADAAADAATATATAAAAADAATATATARARADAAAAARADAAAADAANAAAAYAVAAAAAAVDAAAAEARAGLMFICGVLGRDGGDAMITVDLLMATKPCEQWPRERVEALLARPEIDGSSWVRFAESCLVADAVSLGDLRLTAYRAATPAQRLLGVRRSTRVRVELQMVRWPRVSDEVAAVRADLLRWAAGEDVDLEDVRRRFRDADAYADAYAAADAAAAATTRTTSYGTTYDIAGYAAYVAAYAAAYVAADADADADAEAHEARAGLMFICGVLDGTLLGDRS